MKTFFDEDELIKIYDKSKITKWIFRPCIAYKKEKIKFSIIIYCISIILLTSVIVGFPLFSYFDLAIFILCLILYYLTFLLTLNKYAKNKLKLIYISTNNSFFKHWRNKDIDNIEIEWFIKAFNKKRQIDLTKIEKNDLEFLICYCKSMAEKNKKEFNIGFKFLQLIFPITLSLVLTFLNKQNDKLIWITIVSTSFFIIWFFLKFIKNLYDDYANTKNRKFLTLENMFQIIRLNNIK